MTLSWPLGSTPMKSNPKPCHDVYYGWASSVLTGVLVIGPTMTIGLLFGPFLSYWRGVTLRGFDGVLPHQPLYYPHNLSMGILCTSLFGSRWVTTFVDMSSGHNWSENYKNSCFTQFELIWPCCDLDMTLPCPWGGTPMKHNPIPCHHMYKWWTQSALMGVPVIRPKMTICLLFGPCLPYQRGVT